jgi:hypothetical protein
VVELDNTSEPIPIAGYSDAALAIDACNELDDPTHTANVVYHLRKTELNWHCDFHDIR